MVETMKIDIIYEKEKNGKTKRIAVRNITDAEYTMATPKAAPMNVTELTQTADLITQIRHETAKKEKAIARHEAKLAKLKAV
jgi:phosphoenolpyruvate synthase/pyruvate phosphate dikinase